MSNNGRMAGLYVPSGEAMALGDSLMRHKARNPNRIIDSFRANAAGKPCFIICGDKKLPSRSQYFIQLFERALHRDVTRYRVNSILVDLQKFGRRRGQYCLTVKQVAFLNKLAREAA